MNWEVFNRKDARLCNSKYQEEINVVLSLSYEEGVRFYCSDERAAWNLYSGIYGILDRRGIRLSRSIEGAVLNVWKVAPEDKEAQP